jgi:hypothetical protein
MAGSRDRPGDNAEGTDVGRQVRLQANLVLVRMGTGLANGTCPSGFAATSTARRGNWQGRGPFGYHTVPAAGRLVTEPAGLPGPGSSDAKGGFETNSLCCNLSEKRSSRAQRQHVAYV